MIDALTRMVKFIILIIKCEWVLRLQNLKWYIRYYSFDLQSNNSLNGITIHNICLFLKKKDDLF
jgi:hypothetical protein